MAIIVYCECRRNASGLWQCIRPGCGWLYRLQSNTPPMHKCRNQHGDITPVYKPFQIPEFGVGTELHRLLAKFGIHETEGCKCGNRQALMDAKGPDWCEEHLEQIVDWMENEAHKRGLKYLFNRKAATILVKRSIYNTRKKQGIVKK